MDCSNDNCETESGSLNHCKRYLQINVKDSDENKTKKVNAWKENKIVLNVMKLIINEMENEEMIKRRKKPNEIDEND